MRGQEIAVPERDQEIIGLETGRGSDPERGERERVKFCVINVKYKEISWRVRKKRRRRRRRKKVTSRSTEELMLKNSNFLDYLLYPKAQ